MNDPHAAPLLSIVSPVYQAEEIVDHLVQRIIEAVTPITSRFEIILVEDGSPDHSWDRIAWNAAQDARVKGVRLSRNFGQHHAITAGLFHAQGDYVVVMDCDLQDDPKYIPVLLEQARQGYDVVFTYKKERKHSIFKNLSAYLFHRVFNWLSESDNVSSHQQVGAYSLLTRKVVDAYCSLKDYHRHYLLLLRWLGFSSTSVEIEHAERFSGQSSYSLRRLINHALDGITSQSTRLLRLAIGVGAFFCSAAFLSVGILMFLYFAHGFLEGWTSIIVLTLLLSGVILMFLGVIGLYLGKTFEQVKEKPLFVVAEHLNIEAAGTAPSVYLAPENVPLRTAPSKRVVEEEV